MSDTLDGTPPPPPPPPPARARVLRRSRTNRVAAGVSGGLGEYFDVDPVLFRVLFATSAFFGGAGILAYLLAWAAIPEAGTEHAPVDGWIAALRHRRMPIWVVAIVFGLVLWAVAFSWWAPGPFFPVVAVVVLLVLFFGRREMQAQPPAPPVNLTKPGPPPGRPVTDQPAWVGDARAWFDEARAAARERRRRSLPIRLAVLGTLTAALVGLGIADAITGIALQWYFWTILAIAVAGLFAGLVTRRFAPSLLALLPIAAVGCVAFAGSSASLSDGIGQRQWQPTSVPASEYRLAFGQGILDLRKLPAQPGPRTVQVTMGAGQLKIIAPRTLNLTVRAHVHLGQLDVDTDRNGNTNNGHGHGGVSVSRVVEPPAGATGAPLTVNVHLANGEVRVDHV